jgi:hypothetical protein
MVSSLSLNYKVIPFFASLNTEPRISLADFTTYIHFWQSRNFGSALNANTMI